MSEWVYPWNEPLRTLVVDTPGAWRKLEKLTESDTFYWWGSGLKNGGWVTVEQFIDAVGEEKA